MTFFSLVLAENLLGQEPAALSGSGTENDPYQITSVDDWNAFADAVNDGYDYSGEYIKLKENITINVGAGDKMAGVFVEKNHADNRPFNGTFDGNGNTITFNCGTVGSPIDVLACALFRYTTGVTINNLTVTGTIVSKKKFAAGFIGYQDGSNSHITNCTSNITINGSKIEKSKNGYDCSAGGFIGQVESGNVCFENCVFSGLIDKGTQSSANRCAGFVSYNAGTINYNYCTMAGTITVTSSISTFNRNGGGSFNKAYYFIAYGDVPTTGCAQATETAPNDAIAKIYNISETDYYVPGAVITGLATTTYSYISGETITIDAPVVSYYGRTLTRGTDYVIKKKYGESAWAQVDGDITLSEAGEYKIKIEAKDGSSYGGSQTTTIKVVEFNSWAVVQEYLADASKGDRVITLSSNITSPNPKSDSALVVKGNVILNLNNKTINRNLSDTVIYGQVIRVKKGANLTINGPGIIKGGYNWPGEGVVPIETTYWPKRDGGGIHNMGNLVLNNVDVIYNKCYKEEDGSTNPTARGGGIYSGPGSSLIINGGCVSSNIGRGGGGGVYCDRANPFELTEVDVHANQSDSKGGGLRIKTTGSAIAYLTRCDISWSNQVTGDASQGGGVYLEGGEVVMNQCVIMGNQATMEGAGFYLNSGKVTTVDCEFTYNGTLFNDKDNRGAGICLKANSGSFLMDGGIVEKNNCVHDGGGIYVGNGAVFQVKGDVVIKDNLQAWTGEGFSNNNAYLAGSSVIEVVGELGDDALINITPHDAGGVYVRFAEGVSGQASLSHFKLDNIGYGLMIDSDGSIAIYQPFLWNNTDTWDGTIATDLSGNLPTALTDLIINRAVKIPNGYTAYADNITFGTYGSIMIEDGGQFITDNPVAVSARKNVVAAHAGNETGWYLISSPVNNPSIKNNTNLITEDVYSDPTYDLYRYNEVKDLQWENYRADHDDFTTLQNGRGYLYRNKQAQTIDIGGTLDVSSVSYDLSCHTTTSPSGNANTLKGFNIIGNPYSHNVYKGAAGSAIPNGDLLESKYYMLNPTTSEWDLKDDGTVIPPLTGILVQATKAGTLTMTNSTSGASGAKDAEKKNDNIWFTISNNDYEDRACVEFKEGHGLNKIEHLNEEAPMLYIHHNGEDFASVDMSDNTKQFNLNLEAKTTGKYTLSVEPQGAYKYLHLIDRLAEKDIDLLAEKEYSFIGSSADNAERFIVRLEHSDNVDSSVFAYQSGNEIVVSGEGELQIFDVMGRLVMQKHVNGVESIDKPMTTGVYVLRLNENSQKIVVR